LDEIKNELKNKINEDLLNEMFSELKDFIHTEPQMPTADKKYATTGRITISPHDSKEKIIENIYKNALSSEMALLTLYVYRDMEHIDWKPFIKAAVERNPVCFADLAEKDENLLYQILSDMPNESIYDNKRLALPDEVWNFRRGDGIEKALLMANFILHNDNKQLIKITINDNQATLENREKSFVFDSLKGINKVIEVEGGRIEIG
jgi:hypothetical protein